MKLILGLILCFGGIIVGTWFAVSWCLLGGFVQLAHTIRADQLNDVAVMWAAARIGSTSLAGWAVAHIFMIPGKALLTRAYLESLIK